MKINIKYQYLVISLLLATSIQHPVSARDTGAAFLKIGVGARAVGMSSAFTAIADDASALYWNPSGIATIPKPQVMAMHSDWLLDMNYQFASFIQPTRNGAFGLGFSRLDQGTFEGRDENRERTADFEASDTAATLCLSNRLRRGSLGLNIKFIQQKIEAEQATGVAFDFGGKLQRPGSPLSFGLALQNLGPRMTFIQEGYYLPLTATAGVGYRIAGALSISMDVRRRIYTGNTSVGIGTEYWAFSSVALRMGYLSRMGAFSQTSSSLSDNSGGNRLERISGLGAGVGVRILGYQLDYAFVPYGELGNTNRISLLINFR